MAVAVGKGIYRAHGRSDVKLKGIENHLYGIRLCKVEGFLPTACYDSMDGARAVFSTTVQGLRDLGVREWSSAPRHDSCLTRKDA